MHRRAGPGLDRHRSIERYEDDVGFNRWLAWCCSFDGSVGDSVTRHKKRLIGPSTLLCYDQELGCKKNDDKTADSDNRGATTFMQVYRYFGAEWRVSMCRGGPETSRTCLSQ